MSTISPKSKAARFFAKSTLCLCACLMLSSCVSTRQMQREQFLPKFFIEAVGAELKSPKIVSVQLPVSASVIQIKPIPSIPHFEIERVKAAQGEMGTYLQFELEPKMRLQLMQLCGEYRGRRLVLVVGQSPIGSWRINKILENGIILHIRRIPRGCPP